MPTLGRACESRIRTCDRQRAGMACLWHGGQASRRLRSQIAGWNPAPPHRQPRRPQHRPHKRVAVASQRAQQVQRGRQVDERIVIELGHPGHAGPVRRGVAHPRPILEDAVAVKAVATRGRGWDIRNGQGMLRVRSLISGSVPLLEARQLGLRRREGRGLRHVEKEHIALPPRLATQGLQRLRACRPSRAAG